MTSCSSVAEDVQYYKFGHSVALDHKRRKEVPKLIRPYSPRVKRSPSFPALVPDLSVDMAEEITHRRSVHAAVLDKDKTSFRRKNAPESCSHQLLQKHLTRNLLPDMHPIRDERDINPPKTGYTYTRRRNENISELYSNIEDFIQPDDPTRPRSTGYNPGHVRSMLGFDTFGPRQSERHSREREEGSLPQRHNIDRNSPSTTDSGYRNSADFSSNSVGSSLQSSAAFQRSTTIPISLTYNGSMPFAGVATLSLSPSHSVNSTLHTTIVDPTEKLLVDPRGKGLLWHDSHKYQLQEIKKSKESMEIMRKQREQEELAGQYVHASLSQFEEKLKSMNRYN
eukprot:gene3546-7057_t